MNKLILPHLGILVTTYCNLNCRDCADLIPMRCNTMYEYEQIVKDLKKVLSAVDYIEEILIIGGETLLYPDLEKVIEFCFSEPKIGNLIITTNGVIHPSEHMLDVFIRNKVMVRVSGYSENIVPNRENLVNKLNEKHIVVDNLENMQWMSMGTFAKRNRSVDELKRVFSTCLMRNCAAIKSDGKIYYCSRQLSSPELDFYPNPEEKEIVDVRNSSDLKADIERFLNLQYINTCDYCDGISCATTKIVPTAVQILDKSVFLLLVSCYEQLKMALNTNNNALCIAILEDIIAFYNNNIVSLTGLYEAGVLFDAIKKWTDEGVADFSQFEKLLCQLINRLSDDYDFEVIDNSGLLKETGVTNKRNRITVSTSVDSNADLIISDEDLLVQSERKNAIDLGYYNRLFIESKLAKAEREQVEIAVCGLSYTQYGMLEKELKYRAVNLSVTGEDIPYCLKMAQRVISKTSKLKYLIIPFTYYQGFYDMSADDAELHRIIMEKVNIPLFNYNGRYYEMTRSTEYLQLFDKIADLDAYVIERDNQYKQIFEQMEFFNELFVMPKFGGLKFDFNELSEEEKFKSGAITAELNERIVTEKGREKVYEALKDFSATISSNVKVIFFVPPMTKYLYDAYSDDLKDRFYSEIYPLFEYCENMEFYDWSREESFDDSDFCDYEHLGPSGARKLTALINGVLD